MRTCPPPPRLLHLAHSLVLQSEAWSVTVAATTEEDAAQQVTVLRQEQVVMGGTQQQIVEIPTVQVEEVIRQVMVPMEQKVVKQVPKIEIQTFPEAYFSIGLTFKR